MAAVGSREIATQSGKRFQEAPAPMTAKCIIRDEIKSATRLHDAAVNDLVVSIIQRLATFEYHIEQAQD